jgi:hypothetical protein
MAKLNLSGFSGKVAKAILVLPLAALMMGNQQCAQKVEDEVAKRELRRRVQLGAIDAPDMKFTDGGSFDFKYAANAQMYTILRSTSSFSTSTVAPGPLDPSTMTEEEKQAFYQCEDTSGSSAFQFSQEAACMVHMPQARINGNISNFQITDGKSYNIDLLLNMIGIGVNYKVTKATLSMNFKADHPLITGHNIASSSPTAKSQVKDLNLNLNFNNWGVGFGNYSASDLGKVVGQAMTTGITDLKAQFDKEEAWYAMVLKNCDKAIMINAGSYGDAGLEVGDVLEVYNVWYDWTGDVCSSSLRGAMRASKTPIAVVQVDIVGNTFSQARVIEQTAEKILPGARVYVRKLIEKQVAKK